MLADNRLKIMLAIIVVAMIAIFSIAPIAQQPNYTPTGQICGK